MEVAGLTGLGDGELDSVSHGHARSPHKALHQNQLAKAAKIFFTGAGNGKSRFLLHEKGGRGKSGGERLMRRRVVCVYTTFSW